MYCIICDKPGLLKLNSIDKPVPKKGESLLRIHKIGICGTDIHAFGGNQPYFSYPRILGHELAAEYIEGDSEGFYAGEAVTIMPYFNCGKCIACKQDKPNCCSNIKVFGVHIDGGMAEFIVVPNSFILKGGGLSYDQLALVEPLSIAAHGIRRGMVTKKDTVLILGAGPIGLGLAQFAKLTGAKVFISEINNYRLDFAKKHFDIDACFNPLEIDSNEELSALTNGEMATVVVDATGNQKVINDGLRYLAHGGRFILVGLQKGNLVYSHPEFHKRETTLMSSRNATLEDFEYVISCLKSGVIKEESFITHRLEFSKLPDNFEFVSDPENKVVKAIIDVM